MLISVHLPKTAGTSFLALLESAYGPRLLRDYADRPINRGTLRRNGTAMTRCLRHAFPSAGLRGVDCVHGHFLPLKYRWLPGDSANRFVIWLRDPVQRLLSHYAYWRREYDAATAGDLHRRVVEEDWSVERFCFAPQMQNLYGKFLWGFAPRRFCFIGITEFYDEDVKHFASTFLGAAAAPVPALNVSPGADAAAPEIDAAFERRVYRHHARDMALYEWALSLREARLRG